MTVARWLTVLWIVGTLVALGYPGERLPEAPIAGFDKLVHVALFATGTVLALLGWPRRAAVVLIALVVFAPLTELWQVLLPTGRSADPLDVVANWLGILLGRLVAGRIGGR